MMYSTKKIFRVVGLLLVGLIIYNVSNSFGWFDLEFSDITVDQLRANFSEVQFIGGGNNFGGAILWLKTNSTTTTLEHGTGASYETKTCTVLMRGIYYNNQRGLRIRPLDPQSLNLLKTSNPNYSGLSMTGGFYRNCSPGKNNSIYGSIIYTLTGGSSAITSYLAAGTLLNLAQNKMMTGLANNFQYFDEKTPIGYIYDSAGGIGFVGGELSGHSNLVAFLNTTGHTIDDAFDISASGLSIVSASGGWEFIVTGLNTAQETLWQLMVQGSVNLSRSTDSNLLRSIMGNTTVKTVILGGTDTLNSSTILNIARQNAQNLCRGKTYSTATSLTSSPDIILCFKNGPLNINLSSDSSYYEGKTIIMESGSINLNGTMQGSYQPLEIFINKGVLYVENDGTAANLTIFNAEGFPTSSPVVNKGMYIKGNLILNGLLVGGTAGSPIGFPHKLHLEGKIVSFNSISAPSPGRMEQIRQLLGPSFTSWINLENIFVWDCQFNGSGTDGTPCATGGIASLTPFVVLNGNYPGNLLR